MTDSPHPAAKVGSLLPLGLVFAAAVAALAAACSGGNGGGDVQQLESVQPVIVNSELATGQNRLMIGLLDQDGAEIVGARVALSFQSPGGGGIETEATPVAIEKTYTHVHEDGTLETHSAGESGVYLALVRLDTAGDWTVEVAATVAGRTYTPEAIVFAVAEAPSTVAVGDPAPLSDTLTVDDVDDIAVIDTSDPPIPEMHTMTIAQAVTSGRPSVIVFATPAFCLSRICGPTKSVVDGLFDRYQREVNFVHVEPYDVPRARSGEGLFPVQATEEWGLRSEPWVFVVDGDGIVTAKFEAVVTSEELEQALEPLLST